MTDFKGFHLRLEGMKKIKAILLMNKSVWIVLPFYQNKKKTSLVCHPT